MSHTSSASKALRQSKKRALRNTKVKHHIKELLKKAKKTIVAEKQEEARNFLKEVQKALDKAAQRGILKKNTAARKKSRLAGRFRKRFVVIKER